MKNLRTYGYWSGLSAAIFSIIYSIFQLLTVAKMLTPPWDIAGMFLPSFLLAVSFVILMTCVYFYASEEKKLQAMLGLVFAILYAVLVSIVYFTELAVVIPAMLKNNTQGLDVLIPGPNSFMISVDALGYGFMSVSTLFACSVFAEHRWTYRAMLWNGLLTPVIIFALFYPFLMAIGALWMITLPMSVICMTSIFKNLTSEPEVVTV